MKSSDLSNSNILVVGLGKTGVSIINYLRNKNLNFRVIDSRSEPPNIDFCIERKIEVIVAGLFEEHFIWADTIILSPGVSTSNQVIKNAIANGKEIIGDVELFLREVNSPVVAITGTNGKSTVTSMIDSIGQYSQKNIKIGGNIGTPALDLLDDNVDLYVLELSSFQLETISTFKFDTAVILNLSEDHLDRYTSFDEYCRAKLKLLKSKGNVILNRDDSVTSSYSSLYENKDNITWFTAKEPESNQYGVLDFEKNKWICVNRSNQIDKLFNCSILSIVGDHNILNAVVALMISNLSGIEASAISNGLEKFNGLAHRSQVIKNSNNIKWINDSKATNVAATSAAIEGLNSDTVILIMGGQTKGQDFSILNSVIKNNIKLIILFGQDAKIIYAALLKNIDCVIKSSIRDVISYAKLNAVSGDIVLFSPACASLDMFDNFEHRGDSFKDLVEELVA